MADRAEEIRERWAKAKDIAWLLEDRERLEAELESLADRVDVLREQVARLTQERDEWEANEQAQHQRAEALADRLRRAGS